MVWAFLVWGDLYQKKTWWNLWVIDETQPDDRIWPYDQIYDREKWKRKCLPTCKVKRSWLDFNDSTGLSHKQWKRKSQKTQNLTQYK